MKTDTIAAIATAMTNSGIGIIRISGDDAVSIADRVFHMKSQKKLANMDSHTIHYGHIYDDERLVDEVMVLLMRAPRTYTREDTVEIDCHGGTLVMRDILDTVIRHGARAAEPGEYTKRAFLNGRIDLTQAESVIDVINAKNKFALNNSLEQLNGALFKVIRNLREQLIYEIAYIESALDDPEHFSLEDYPEQLSEKVKNISAEIDHLLAGFEDGVMLKEGINTVIVGKPNAGKSSLMNMLVGHDRAIVTDIAGTTRDIIEEQINLGGIQLNIIDTAGIRETEDVIEKIGVDRSLDYMERADLILYVMDSSEALDENDMDIIRKIKDKNTLILMNKSDLAPVIHREDIEALLQKEILLISAKEGSGKQELEEAVRSMFFHGEVTFNDEVYITNARHKAALQEAKESLAMVLNSIEDGMTEDFFGVDLMNAYTQLGLIIGEAVEDDLVQEIFSKFCMGK